MVFRSGRVVMASLVVSLLFLVAPSAASAFGFQLTWGWGVADGGSAFQVCMSSCHAGAAGSGDGQLNQPRGVATDAAGNVYVADTNINDRVEKFTASGAFVTKWGGSGTGDGKFSFPWGIAVDGAGNVYVADYNHNRIEKFDSSGGFLGAWGWGVADGSATFEVCTSSCHAGVAGSGDGQFSGPQGIATDPAGNLYVADHSNDRVEKFSSSGAYLGKWGGTGTTEGKFKNPDSVATDAAGNVYVTEFDSHRVQKFTSSGTFLLAWGWGVSDGNAAFEVCTSACQAGVAGPGDGQLQNPTSVATDPNADVYVTDSGNNRVEKFSSSGAFLSKWGTNGTAEGEFMFSQAIATDCRGNVYVDDLNNNRVQKFGETGAPAAPCTTSTAVSCQPASVTVGQATACSATVSDAAGGRTPTGSVSFMSSATGSFGSGDSCALTPTGTAGVASCQVSYAPADAGAHVLTVSYPGDAGHTGSQGSTTLPVSAPGGGGGDVTAPVVQSASASPATFAVDTKGRSETVVSAKAKRGTTFKYTLSESARVVFTIRLVTSGRKSGGKCVKPTIKNRKKKKCNRYTLAGRFAVQSAVGANTHRFSGKVGARKLKPGTYRLTLVASDAANNHSLPRTLTIKIVKR